MEHRRAPGRLAARERFELRIAQPAFAFRNVRALAERGKLDAVFFADSRVSTVSRARDAFSCTDLVKLEPSTLLAALAATTKNVGLVATASTSWSLPYTLVRQYASLDHMSGGRIGWNIVTSTGENEAHNMARTPTT